MKFLRIQATVQHYRCGVQHPTSKRYYPLQPIPVNEVGLWAKKVQEAGGELLTVFNDPTGQPRNLFTPDEIQHLRDDPRLIVDDVELTIADNPPSSPRKQGEESKTDDPLKCEAPPKTEPPPNRGPGRPPKDK